ncbi:MAG TPA: substrate binding domain-containing protein, partial [Burkholderiaceae bacterium]|nr:substrate binding domain-containing protein [Burkholderiaceae bacterium]
ISILSTKEPLQGDFVARRLARTEVILCAAPEYLQRRGRPQHPVELQQHDVLVPPLAIQQRGIVFLRGPRDGAPEERVEGECRRGVLTTGHNDTNYAAALHGLGIAALPSFMIEDALMEHALERVMPRWRLQSYDIWAAMPSRKFLPARTRVFLDFLVGVFGGQDHDPWLEAAGCATC